MYIPNEQMKGNLRNTGQEHNRDVNVEQRGNTMVE
jgi:hypothetical protein